MATKLLRLVNDKKKAGDVDVHVGAGGRIYFLARLHEVHRAIVVTSVVSVYVYVYVYVYVRVRVTLSVKVFRIVIS